MKKYLPFIAAGGALAFLYFRSIGETLTNLRANLVDIVFLGTKTKQASYTRLYFKLMVAFENPGTSAATVTAARFNLIYQGKLIATADTAAAIELLGKSRTVAPFEVVVPVTKLFNIVSDAIKAIVFKRPMTVNVTGEINAGAAVIKINESKTIAWNQ